jgi:hypothetical protein
MNRAFVYSSGWRNEHNSKAYGGSYKQSGDKAGSWVTLNFTGQSMSILYTTGPDFGRADIYLDGAVVGSIDEKASTLNFQQQWDYLGTLTSGAHTLKLVQSGGRRDKITLDAVIIH